MVFLFDKRPSFLLAMLSMLDLHKRQQTEVRDERNKKGPEKTEIREKEKEERKKE